jgi:hypothetical protein
MPTELAGQIISFLADFRRPLGGNSVRLSGWSWNSNREAGPPVDRRGLNRVCHPLSVDVVQLGPGNVVDFSIQDV